MTVSFTHPHDPYVARRKYWDLYEDCAHLMPQVPTLPFEDQDPHSRRILNASDWHSYTLTEDMVARSRRAYFANISYVDDKIGQVLAALEATRQEAVIVFVSDHGDMLGERGLWFKMTFFEGSARVPLMICAPGLTPGVIGHPVSTLDVMPTLCDLAGVALDEIRPWTDGTSLLPLATGQGGRRAVPMEYAAEASETPMVGLRKGRWKLILCPLDPDLLFDLEADPQELHNLAPLAEHAATLAELKDEARALWDLDQFDSDVRASQARRLIVYQALRNGAYYPWDFQPLQKASERYMRNHMDLNVLETNQRFPRGE
jgi:choline-sulfatase